MHSSLIQVIKVQDQKSGIAKLSGRPYTMQEAECLLLSDDGSPVEVGVFMVPKDMIGKLVAGHYLASFTLGTDRERRVTARVVQLRPVKVANGKVTMIEEPKAA
jgi:hypothetical protein